jgi:hypothetical protein
MRASVHCSEITASPRQSTAIAIDGHKAGQALSPPRLVQRWEPWDCAFVEGLCPSVDKGEGPNFPHIQICVSGHADRRMQLFWYDSMP